MTSQQNQPVWDAMGMDSNLSPPWTSFNIAKAVRVGILKSAPDSQPFVPPSKPIGLVNDSQTRQSHSLIDRHERGNQALYVPVARDAQRPLPPEVQQYNLYFDPVMISIMFGIDEESQLVRVFRLSEAPNTFTIDRAYYRALARPIIEFTSQQLDEYIIRWMPHSSEQSRDSLRTLITEIVFPCRFDDATPEQCEILRHWWDGMTTKVPELGRLE
jgi:hypothetical protein